MYEDDIEPEEQQRTVPASNELHKMKKTDLQKELEDYI